MMSHPDPLHPPLSMAPAHHVSPCNEGADRWRGRWSRQLVALLGAMLLLCAAPTPALAQTSDGEVSRLTVEVSNEIYSPFCPGKTLMMCPSPNAAKVRRDIQDLARTGMEKEAIKNQIVATYGEEFRITEPPAQDNALLITIILVALLIAVLAVVLLSRRKKLQRHDRQGARRHTPSQERPLSEAEPDGEHNDDLSDEERAYLDELRAHLDD